jgi:hypothetical protein
MAAEVVVNLTHHCANLESQVVGHRALCHMLRYVAELFSMTPVSFRCFSCQLRM